MPDAAVLEATFSVSREVFGVMRTIELKPGGADILVTNENRQGLGFSRTLSCSLPPIPSWLPLLPELRSHSATVKYRSMHGFSAGVACALSAFSALLFLSCSHFPPAHSPPSGCLFGSFFHSHPLLAMPPLSPPTSRSPARSHCSFLYLRPNLPSSLLSRAGAEYVELYTRWLLVDSVARQFAAFKAGFDLAVGSLIKVRGC